MRDFRCLLLAMLLVPSMALAAPPVATQSAGKPAATKPATPVPPRPDRIQVAAATSLVGRSLRDAQGRRLGDVDFLLFDRASGALRDVVLAPSVELRDTGDFVALPWTALTRPLPPLDRPIDSTASAAQLTAAAAMPDDRLFALADPDAADTVFRLGRGGAPGLRRHTAGRAGMPASLISATDLEGTEIVDDAGQVVGTVDRVMIDTAAGRVAYLVALAGTGAMAGLALAPVPFTPLEWSATSATFRMPVHHPLDSAPGYVAAALDEGLQQRPVDRALLRALFAAFDAPPYWSDGTPPAASAQPAPPAKP